MFFSGEIDAGECVLLFIEAVGSSRVGDTSSSFAEEPVAAELTPASRLSNTLSGADALLSTLLLVCESAGACFTGSLSEDTLDPTDFLATVSATFSGSKSGLIESGTFGIVFFRDSFNESKGDEAACFTGASFTSAETSARESFFEEEVFLTSPGGRNSMLAGAVGSVFMPGVFPISTSPGVLFPELAILEDPEY